MMKQPRPLKPNAPRLALPAKGRTDITLRTMDVMESEMPPAEVADAATSAYVDVLVGAPRAKQTSAEIVHVPRSQQRAQSRYILASQIASGGMASVHIALQQGAEGFNRVVAMKRIHPHLAQHRQFCDMFIDEARIAARINHPSVCRTLDFGRGDDGYFLTMEYLQGEPLSRVLRAVAARPDMRESPRYPLLLARIFAELAEGLHAAHSLKTDRGEPLDVVHRDVTPQNLFVLYDGTVRVTDFGIAQARQRVHHTQGELLKGKLSYMAPELLQRKPLDHRADIWSLGVVLWECLTFERLFRGHSEGETLMHVMSREIPPPSTRNPQVTLALDAVLERALARDPDERYENARELAGDLERCLGWSSDTVPKMDIAEWMRDLFPGGAERSAELIRSALVQSSIPPAEETEESAAPPPVVAAAPAPRAATKPRPRTEANPMAPTVAVVDAMDGDGTLEPTGTVSTDELISAGVPHRFSLSLRKPKSYAIVGAAMLGVAVLAGGLAWNLRGQQVPAVTVAAPPARMEPVAATPAKAIPGPEKAAPKAITAAPAPGVPAATPPVLDDLDDGLPQAPPHLRVATGAAPHPVAPPKPAAAPAPAPAPKSAPSADVRLGSVLITASNGAVGEISENGTVLGRTPARLNLPVGKHTLAVRPIAGGSPRLLSVNVSPGSVAFVNVGLPTPAAPAASAAVPAPAAPTAAAPAPSPAATP